MAVSQPFLKSKKRASKQGVMRPRLLSKKNGGIYISHDSTKRDEPSKLSMALLCKESVVSPVPAWLQKAIDAHQSGKLQIAEGLYRDILKVEPRHPDANHNLGVLGASLGRTAAALPYFKVAVDQVPGHTQYWVSYISALLDLRWEREAEAAIKQAEHCGLYGEAVTRLKSRLVQPNSLTSDREIESAISANIGGATHR